MTIKDILTSASDFPSNFQKALANVLPKECEFEADGFTIRKERPDSHGWTVAGLNQQDDGLKIDLNGNCLNPPEWFASTYYKGNDAGSTGYWLACSCNRLPFPLNVLVFCQAVNQGIGAEGRILQLALNDYGAHLTIDGQIGQATCQAAMACPDSMGLALGFLAKSRAHYRDIVAANPNDQKDLQGWLNRIAGLQAEFCNASTPSVPVSAVPTATHDQDQDEGLVITPTFQT